MIVVCLDNSSIMCTKLHIVLNLQVSNSLMSDNSVSAPNLDSISNDGASLTEDITNHSDQMKAAFCVMATDGISYFSSFYQIFFTYIN